MEAARHQTSAVIGTLVDNHQRFLSFLTSRVGNPSEAEEILQAAFVKSVEKSDSIRDEETVVAWFYRLLRNAVIDYYRRRDAERRALERAAGMSTEEETLEAEFERAVCQCVNGLLPTLKDDYSALLRRVDLEGASIVEVSKETGITTNNTRVKLHRARTALRKQLELSCGSCAEHGCLDCTCRRSD
ncbi:MAG: sigma-70 family RNA polymerase sigma factor [Candidatus Bathyarchaeota archaeon]|nr:sigma-70 family RNA polymerase sigma factor [Candidatus Bathyarchaeota archaeon]